MSKEYGGFLPLELNDGNEYYNYGNKQIQRYNCAKAAVAFLLESLNIKKIYLPYYLCPNVCKEIEKHNLEVVYYSLDKNLLPQISKSLGDECIYLVNYFGVMDSRFISFVHQLKVKYIILDQCHSFFCQPLLEENVYNIYSCKKFFGVPDGAYLIGKHLPDAKIINKTYSSEYALYLLQCLERGTNYCYQNKKDTDKLIASNYGGMSILSEKILKSINYVEVERKRKENYSIYQNNFENINLINCEKECTPYVYPFNIGLNIKANLIKKKIYVPTLWSSLLSERFKDSFEYWLSENTIFLPLDQRYNKDDIEHIVKSVKEEIENAQSAC